MSERRSSRGLEEYQAKRDFEISPEPSGKAAARAPAKGPIFCVQKHLASHLHYDFRLEYRGVLLSWAVPKGPSLNPADKRLAMMVEDHPLEYADFEGVIPEGYGAGIVMLWDTGTWEPEADMDEGLTKGSLKFHLDGFKLKGSWALVRTRSAAGRRKGPVSEAEAARSWLLIKHRDEWAGELDVVQFAPLSVKSQLDLTGILATGQADLWQSHKPADRSDAYFEKIIAKALEIEKENQQHQAAGLAAPPAKRSRHRTG